MLRALTGLNFKGFEDLKPSFAQALAEVEVPRRKSSIASTSHASRSQTAIGRGRGEVGRHFWHPANVGLALNTQKSRVAPGLHHRRNTLRFGGCFAWCVDICSFGDRRLGALARESAPLSSAALKVSFLTAALKVSFLKVVGL